MYIKCKSLQQAISNDWDHIVIWIWTVLNLNCIHKIKFCKFNLVCKLLQKIHSGQWRYQGRDKWVICPIHDTYLYIGPFKILKPYLLTPLKARRHVWFKNSSHALTMWTLITCRIRSLVSQPLPLWASVWCLAMYKHLTSKMPGVLCLNSGLFMMHDILGGLVMMPSREALSNPDSCSQIPIRMKTDNKLHIMCQLCHEVMNCKLNLENIHYSF